MSPAPFIPAVAPAGSLELEAYHYGRAAAYETAARLVERLVRQDWTPAGMIQAVPGVEAVKEVAARLRSHHRDAEAGTEAAHGQRRAVAAREPEAFGDPATELYWRGVEQAAIARQDTEGAVTAYRRRLQILGIQVQALEAEGARTERGAP